MSQECRTSQYSHYVIRLYFTSNQCDNNLSLLSFSVIIRDADETISWINEKDTLLSTDDYGRDLPSVQALERKHDGLERDLNALEDKVEINH